MTGQAFFVLTALAGGPRHGYGIVREVEELSQGRVQLKIGSLYGVLDRLAAEGLIEELTTTIAAKLKDRGRRRAWNIGPRGVRLAQAAFPADLDSPCTASCGSVAGVRAWRWPADRAPAGELAPGRVDSEPRGPKPPD